MPEALTPELLVYGFALADDPRISPDGTSILYRLTNVDPETRKATSQIWRCDVDGRNGRQMTRAGKQNTGACWSPDSTQIAFVSDRNGAPGLFLMPANEIGEARELTSRRSGIGQIAWSPDGTQIAYTSSVDPDNPTDEAPDPEAPPSVRVTRRLDYKEDGRGYLNNKRMQVFVIDVTSGEVSMVTQEAVDHYLPQWSPDGKTLAVGMLVGPIHSQLALVDLTTRESNVITPRDGLVEIWSWSPNGNYVLYAFDEERSGQSDFYVYDRHSGASRRLTGDSQVVPGSGYIGLDGQSSPVWLDDQRALFTGTHASASGLYTISLNDGAVEKLHGWEANLIGLSVDDARHYAVQSLTSFETTGEISVYDLRTGKADIITHHNASLLESHPPAQYERFEVQRGEYTIESWLLKPANFDPSRKYPVVLDIHGGPQWYFGHSFYPIEQVLATNGFLVIVTNPRGSTSYGRDFAKQVLKDWGGEDFKDLMAVVDTVLGRPYADATRTGMYGYSYGGYMTSWILGQTGRFQACVCGAPCFDLESMYGTSDIGYSFGEEQWGSAPHAGKEWYEAHSPSTFAHRATTPTLIVQGEADDRCPIGQGEQMFVALKKANCEVEFARYPGGSHVFPWVGEPAHREDLLRRVLEWFTDHLGEPV